MEAEIKTYLARWQAVAEIERQEQQASTVALRWQQLNSAIGIAMGLGISKPVEDETEVFQRWAKLKEKITSQDPAG